jgi:carbamoyltransferase
MANILGIACFYHDAAAALMVDGQLVAAAEEERFTRKKHDDRFPTHAIHFCLDRAGLTAADLDYVGFYEKPFLKLDRILLTNIATFPRSFGTFMRAIPLWLKDRLHIPEIIARELGDRRVLFIEHHVAHAASAFLVSPFNEAAILTVDGVGEWATSTQGTGRGGEIALDREIRFPHSLGLLYSAVTAHLGFQVNSGEGKVMGLAAYGQPTYLDALREIVRLKPDGSFHLDLRYFAYPHAMRMTTRRWEKRFGPPRRPESAVTRRDEDLAASLQAMLEEVLLTATRALHERTRLTDLSLAGGVSLNCVANGRILRETPFERLFVQPGAGDSGAAIGVAAYIHAALLKGERRYVMREAYLGPDFTDADVEAALGAAPKPRFGGAIRYRRLPEPDLLRYVAQQLAEGRIVGWFQGRMEFGPRALGNRSILANPMRPDMKDVLNHRVKHREPFRPFAPSVLVEEARRFFDLSIESPFMLIAAPVHAAQRQVVPAITHVDGTARIQTVARDQNPRYYDLIAEFGRQTCVPMVLNTSFNVRGEPIVCSPADALNCFLGTDMDCLVMHEYVVEKERRPPEKGD